MKILYAGTMHPTASTHTRIAALRRLGYHVLPFNTDHYESGNRYFHALTFRLSMGPGVERLNRDLLQLAEAEKPDIFWADKVLYLKPSTLQTFRKHGVFSLCYVIDNAFGPRKDPGWRLYKRTIPFFDLHCTQRDVSFAPLQQRGARHVFKTQTAFDHQMHFPPPSPMHDDQRDREVSFLGSPYDNRADFLTRLHQAGVPVVISGSQRAWSRALPPDLFQKLYRQGELAQGAYREAIWRSRINLSFITHSNQDEFTQKTFEIAGCGAFQIAERSRGHTERFVEDQEAVFFSSFEECLEKIRRYLPDEAARDRIASAGHERARTSGYDYDHQMQLILDRIAQLRAAPAPSAS